MSDRVTLRGNRAAALLAKIEKASAAALNRAISTTRTDAQRRIATATGLPAKIVRSRLAVQQATPAKLEAVLTVKGRPVPLVMYAARQTRPGVTFASGASRSLLPHAFVAKGLRGNKSVFLRRTRERLPLAKQFGDPLPLVATRENILEASLVVGEKAFQERLKHELGRER